MLRGPAWLEESSPRSAVGKPVMNFLKCIVRVLSDGEE